VSDTVTLVAGVLLTSVGLLALLPYVLRQGWRHHTGDLAADSGLQSVLAAVETFAETSRPEPPDDQLPRTSVSTDELEELLAHLFSLRMTVNEITGEVQEARDSIDDEGSDDVAADPEAAAKPSEHAEEVA